MQLSGIFPPTGDAEGAILALSNAVPELSVEIFDRTRQGDHAGARQQQATLTALVRAFSPYGIGGLKAALDMRGSRGGQPRPPRVSPDSAGRAGLEKALHTAGVLDVPA